MADSLEQRLAAMQNNMAQQMEDYDPNRGQGNFDPLPDDTYSVKVKPVLQLSKPPANKLMVAWTFIVADGNFEGRQIFDNTTLQGNEGVDSVHQAGSHICRMRLEALGKSWPDRNLKMLKRIVDEVNREEPTISVNLRQKQGGNSQYTNYNVYFQTGDASAPADSGAEDSGAGDPGADAGAGTDARPLIDFCTKHEINGITDDMDDQTIIDSFRASGLTFTAETEIDADEEELLKSLGGEDLIVPAEPAPAPTPAPRATITKKKAMVTPSSPARRSAPPARRAAPARRR
jgi:hypothetical protein